MFETIAGIKSIAIAYSIDEVPEERDLKQNEYFKYLLTIIIEQWNHAD